jgi:hypothetical protein
MTEEKRAEIGSRIRPGISRWIGFGLLVSMPFACAMILGVHVANADEPFTVSLTLKDQKFQPAEVHAPAGMPIMFRVKNLNPIVSEFESSDLHFEKIVPAGSEIVVHVRPQQPGRYNFYDDFHHETQGFLVVP